MARQVLIRAQRCFGVNVPFNPQSVEWREKLCWSTVYVYARIGAEYVCVVLVGDGVCVSVFEGLSCHCIGQGVCVCMSVSACLCVCCF